MATLAPEFSVTRFDDMREVHFKVSGFWTTAKMLEFQGELLREGRPFIERGIKFRALGDMTDLVTQDREMADQMRFTMMESTKLGMEKLAVVISSVMLKMQYNRLTDGMDIKVFEEKSSALRWLRDIG